LIVVAGIDQKKILSKSSYRLHVDMQASDGVNTRRWGLSTSGLRLPAPAEDIGIVGAGLDQKYSQNLPIGCMDMRASDGITYPPVGLSTSGLRPPPPAKDIGIVVAGIDQKNTLKIFLPAACGYASE